MTVFALVHETVALLRAYQCEHAWEPSKEPGLERCSKCAVRATAEGKVKLAEMAGAWQRRRTGR